MFDVVLILVLVVLLSALVYGLGHSLTGHDDWDSGYQDGLED